MKFCPVCRYAQLHKVTAEGLVLECYNCGEAQPDTKGGLILEIHTQQRSSEGYKILLNEFTKFDPTLPHSKTIKCPNGQCTSNLGTAEKDVIYIKYDPMNMKYLYICTLCDKQWRSRS
jgi:DNA-directed RNA polymerase subunit M/transcription elongation factor TFIIS